MIASIVDLESIHASVQKAWLGENMLKNVVIRKLVGIREKKAAKNLKDAV